MSRRNNSKVDNGSKFLDIKSIGLVGRNTGFQASKNIAVDELGMEDLDAFFESPKKTSSTNSNTNNLASLLESGLNKPKGNQLSSLFSQYNLTPEVSPPPPTQAEQEKISTKEKDGVQNKSPNIPASETQDTPTKVSSSSSKDKQPLSSLLNQFKPPQSTTNADTSANSTQSLFKPVSPTVSKPSSQPRRVSSPFVQSEFDQSEDMDMDISQESIADQGNTNERNKISTNPFASAIIPSEEEVTTTVEKSINVQQAQSKVTKSVSSPKAKTSSKQSAVLSAKATNIKVTKQVVASSSSSSSSNKSKPKAISKQKPLLRSFSDLSQDASGGDSESEDDFPDFGTFSNSIGDSTNKEAVSKTSKNNNSSTGANKTGSSNGKTLKNGNGEFLFSEAREEEDPFSISIEEGENGDDDKSQKEEINKKSITTTNNKRGKKAAGKNANNINNKGPNRKTRENTSPPASSSSSSLKSKDKEAKDINKKSSRINKKRRAPVVSVSDDENDDIDNNNNNDNNTNEKTGKDVNQSVSLVSQSPNSKKKKKPIAKRRSLKEKSKPIIVEQSSDEEDDVCIIPKSQSTIVNVSPVTTNVTKEVDDSSDLIDPIEAELEANTLDFDVENENENDQDEQQQEEEEQLQKSVINIPKKTKQSKPKISSAATTAKRKERQTKAPPKVAKRTINKTSNPRSTKKSNKENETIENDDNNNNNNNNDDDVSEVTPINNNNRLSNSEEINDDNNEQQFDPDCSVMLISSSITKPNGEVITIPVDGDLPPPSTYTRTTRGRSRRNQTDTILFEPGNNNNNNDNNFISIYETLEKDIELLKETKKYVESGKAKNLIKVDAYKAPVTEYSTNNLLAKAEERKKVDMILAWGSIDAAKSINTTTGGINNNNNNEGESDNNTSISSSPPVISCNSKSYTISPLFPGQDDDAESSFMGGGVIEFKPYGVKAYTQSLDVQLIFYILGGAVEVQVQDNIFTLTKGGSFTVPRGNGYSIKNVLKNKSKLFFVQAKDTEGSLKRKSIKRKRKD